tara:strand:- start:419 stop:1501 length:1083 start_codon:yes stop_codon:yes gene_type:complete
MLNPLISENELKILVKSFQNEAAKNKRLTGWLKGMESKGVSRVFTTLEGIKKYIYNWSYIEQFDNTRENFSRKQDIEASKIVHEKVLSRLFGEMIESDKIWQSKGGDVVNAQDYFFLSSPLINLPRKDITVLDYGAGYGRGINFLKELGCTNYIVTDAIENSYIAQYAYLKTFCDIYSWNLDEAFINSKFLNNLDSKSNIKKIKHIPTWQLKKLVENSVDLIMFNQSLTEFSKQSALYALSEANRLLKQGGYIYIRDNDFITSEHNINEDDFLKKRNIVKIYDSPFKQNHDIHGSIRIYRKATSKLIPTMYVGRLNTRNPSEMFLASIFVKNKFYYLFIRNLLSKILPSKIKSFLKGILK